MDFKRLIIAIGFLVLAIVIAFSVGCQNQPTGPEMTDFLDNLGAKLRITSDQTGTHDGFFYSFWTNGGGSVNMDLESGGGYSVEWSNCGNFVCGKGWNPGAARTITWSGSASGAQYFGLYGWMQNPLVEYYIPRSGGTTNKGTYQADGTTYTLTVSKRVNQPSIEGTATFDQYFCGGGGRSVNFGEHLGGWKSLGMSVGTQHYQIVAVEGWGGSSGNASVMVSGSDVDTTNTTTTTVHGGGTSTTTTSGGWSTTTSSTTTSGATTTSGSSWWGGGSWWGSTTTTVLVSTTTTAAFTTTTIPSTTTSGSTWWGGGSWWGSTTTTSGYTTTTAASTTTTSGSSWWGGGSWW